MNEIENFMNDVTQNPLYLKSQFLHFFLSCANTTKFYEKRKMEFSNSWITDIKKKFQQTTEDHANITKATEGNDRDNDQEHAEITDEMKHNIFLEDVYNTIKLNRLIHKDLLKELQTLQTNMDTVAKSLGSVGSLFEKLFTNYLEIEKHDVSAVKKVSPPTSRLYSELKTIFFRLQNVSNNHKSIVKKLFDPCIGNILSREDTLVDVISFYQKLKLRKGFVESMNTKGGQIVDESEKNFGPAELRASKLSKLLETNKILYKETEQNLIFEGTDVFKCWKEFTEKSLHDIEAESKMWLEIMNRGKITSTTPVESSQAISEPKTSTAELEFKHDVL